MDFLNKTYQRYIPDDSFFKRFVDILVNTADEYEDFILYNLVQTFDINQEDKTILLNALPEFETFLKRLDIIETNKDFNLTFNLTNFGRKCKTAKGHSIILKQQNDNAAADKEREVRKGKADSLDLSIKQWQVKTKWFPYAFSLFALVLSIAPYFKHEKKQVDLQPMRQQIQQLQDRVKSLDSLHRVDTLQTRSK